MKFSFWLIAALQLSLALTYDTTIMSTCAGSCATNCKICYGASCVDCKTGYALNSSANTCTKYTCTITGCSACNYDGAVCLTCTDAYSIFCASNNACAQNCPLSNCAKCIAGSTSCTTCNTGYSLYPYTNQCIPSIIYNCLVVYDFRNKQFRCTLCKARFKPSKDQIQCIADTCSTVDNCQICAVSTVCTQCRVGYAVSSGGCQKNICGVSNCLYCDNAGVCLRCESPYTLSGGQCIKKQCSLSNCATCKPGSIFCDQCSTGYTLNIWTKNCDLSPSVNTSSSDSNLILLWLLTIPVVIIIVVIITCVLKKLRNADSSMPAATKQPIDYINESKQPIDIGLQNVQKCDNHSSPNKKGNMLEPIKNAPLLPKQLP